MSSPQFNLSQNLVGERVAHDKTGMASGTSKVHKASLCQQNDVPPIRELVTVNLKKHTCTDDQIHHLIKHFVLDSLTTYTFGSREVFIPNHSCERTTTPIHNQLHTISQDMYGEHQSESQSMLTTRYFVH